MSDSPADIVDANGVWLNKLGISDSEQLSAVEYETTRRRAAAILNGEALAHLQGFGIERLQAIHRFLFETIYEWAGNLREMASAKDIPGTQYTAVFTAPSKIADDWKGIEQAAGQFVAAQGLSYEQKLDALMDIFVAANNSHPFLEGNGRALQVFMTQLALEQGIRLNFSMATDNPAMKNAWNHASAMSGVYGVLVDDDTPGENWELSQVIPPDRRELAEFFRYIASEVLPRQESALREQPISPNGYGFRSERAPWGDFPSVIRNGDLGTLQQEPEYQAAKNGDSAAALALVNRLLTNETVSQIKAIIGDRRPLLVPVLAVENAGNNKIPLAMAEVLAERLGLETEVGILQREKIGRTNSGADHRLAFNPTFTGTVKPGQEYLILDDTLTMGGTIASLRGFIENRGGKVIAASVMTAHPGAVDISVNPGILQAIEQKHGSAMDDFWKESFGYGIECLTRGEAGHLRKAPSVDAIRTRISAARNAGGFSLDAGATAAEQREQQREQQRTVVQELRREAAPAASQSPSSSTPKILISFIGPPCAGKSYWAQEVSRALGCPYVSEYATHLIRQGRADAVADQVLVTGGQMGLLADGFRNSNMVASDSDGALGYIYCRNPADLPVVHDMVESSKKGVIVITVFVRHNQASLDEYTEDGRIHNKEQSLAIQDDILLMLDGKRTFEGSRNGEPFFFTPEARQYITVERGASLNELVEKIKHQIQQQLPTFQQSQHIRSQFTMTQAAPNSKDTTDCLSDLTKCLDLIQTNGRLVTSTQRQQHQPTDEELLRKYSGNESFPEVVPQMLDASIADRVTTPTSMDAFGAGLGAREAIEIAQKHFFGGQQRNVGLAIKDRVSEMAQRARASIAHNSPNEAIRGTTVLTDALSTADTHLDELWIPEDQQARVKAFIKKEWAKNTEPGSSVLPLRYALNLAQASLSEQKYNPDLQMARAVMIKSLMAHPERIEAGLAHAYYIQNDESRQYYTKEERAHEASKYIKDLPKAQEVMAILNSALDAASMVYHETEQAKLVRDLKGLHDTLVEKGGKRFLNNDSLRLLALIRAENEKSIPITRPSLDNVDAVSGFNVVDWKAALNAESRIQTIKVAADIAKKYGVDFKHERRMIVGRALDGQDAFFQNNYNAPTAVVRMLLPKELFKKLCDAHKELAKAEAEVAKTGPFVVSPESIQAHQARSRCSEALHAIHTETLAAFQKAANEHYVALVENNAGYLARLGESQFGVPIKSGHGQDGIERLVQAHESVLKGVCLHEADTKAIEAYQPAADAAFHETNCGVPKDAPFSAMPFSLEDGSAAHPSAKTTATAKPPTQRQDQSFSQPMLRAG